MKRIADLEQVSRQVPGSLASEFGLMAINLRVNDCIFLRSGIAEIRRGHVEPLRPPFRWDRREPEIGLAIAMRAGGNLLD